MKTTNLILTILGVLFFHTVFSQGIPRKIPYQGKLLENGIPVNGIKNITFTIDSWSETKNVQIKDGLYSVILGESIPILPNIFDTDSALFLQISVEGTELLPPTEISSVPYAYKSETAVNAENVFSGDYNDLKNKPVDNDTSSSNETINFFSFNPNSKMLFINDGSGVRTVDLSSLGVLLPYFGIYEGDDAVAFSVWASKTTNSRSVFSATTNGTGASGYFEINNQENNNPALYAVTKGIGPAASFRINKKGNTAPALYTTTNEETGYAAYFDGRTKVKGDMIITGKLTKSSGSFRIDHPLVPSDKYLQHSFVESPDMMNIYNGNIFLNKKGEAVVELPDYFEALNMEFRYQLTCIGNFAPVYISEKIINNKFKISGGKPGMEVSWQVTGIRHDPYANKNRIQVEVEKTKEEKGKYLHYREYNQPIENSIDAINDSDLIK